MATPGRVTRSTRASSTIDAQSTISSPDPLNTSFDSVAQPSARVTRSAARALTSTAKSVPARSSSPRKQTFALDVGSTKKPSRLFVTVEAEGSEILEGNSGDDFKDAKRVLFPTPTPKRKRGDTTTTSIPLRDEDTPAARTPGRRGRPRRQQTPMKQVPARKRAKLSADAEDAAESPEKPAPKSSRKVAAGTPAVKATPGRKRKAPFVPEETITWASPSPPKRLRESPSLSIGDEAPAEDSPASSGFLNEPAEDTVAQEDFSPIFAHSLGSLRASLREQETQEIGEATSLIIEGALEELRQSRGEVVQSTEQDDELLEDVKEPEGVQQPEGDEQVEQIDHTEQVDHIEQIDQSEHVDQPDPDEPLEHVDHVEQINQPQSIDQHNQVDKVEPVDQVKPVDQSEPVKQLEQDDQPEQINQVEDEVDQLQHVDQPNDSPEPAAHFDEHDDSPEPVDHSDEVDLPEQVTQPDESTGEMNEAEEVSAPRTFGLNYADFSSSVATKRRSSPKAPVSPFRDDEFDLPKQVTQPDESTGEMNDSEEVSAPRTYGLNYADFSSSVATKRRSSPRAPVSPIREDDGSDYEDSFSEIPQEILDAAAPRGNWPGEAHLKGSPAPVLEPRAPSVDLGARPSLSPIVRAGRALQSVTSDDASPRSHKNHLGSPFKPAAAASTPVQRTGQAPEQQTEDRPQSAASKKSWISDIIEAGVNWFAPTHATSHASADSLSVGQDAEEASPSLPPTRPAPTEASVFNSQSRLAARQATVADEDDEEEDIWALEALRDTNTPVRPTERQSSKAAAETAPSNRTPFLQRFTNKRPTGSKPGSEGKRTIANRSSAFKRSVARSSWKPSSVPMSSEAPAQLDSETSEYSLIADGKQPASAKRSATQQGNEGSAKRRKDMTDFFSSPALLPGAENAQSALERKRLELAPKATVKSTPQPYSLPTTTMFPSDRPFFKPPVDSPAPAAPALVPQIHETPKPSPQEFDVAERNRAIRQARFAFRRALSETREEHNRSGAQGDLPPFGVDLTTVQFPQAFKFPRDTDLDVIMTREEVSKWAQETSNVESSSPGIRHQPNRHASPTKSCLRPSTKPRTPGPRLQWGSDVLSPSGKLEKLAVDQLKQQFITDFKGAMYNERLHEQFGQSKEVVQAVLANKENDNDFIPLPATPTRDIDMMDVDSFVEPANRPVEQVISISPAKAPSTIIQHDHDSVIDQHESISPVSNSTVESTDTTTPAPQWGYDDWCHLEDLFHLRKKGPFPFDFPEDFEPRSRHLVGLTMTSHGERMRINPWHISIIDGFQANTGRKWPDEEIARKVMSLAIVDLLRTEKREPKKPYRHTRKAAYRAQAAST